MTNLKERNIVMILVLSLITCGIYPLYWYIVAISELNDEQIRLGTKTKIISPIVALLLGFITFGIFLIYAIYTWTNAIEEICEYYNYKGAGFALTFILWAFFSVAGIMIVQSDMNQIVKLAGTKSEVIL